MASEWDCIPEITSVGELRRCLNEGLPLPGNLIITRKHADVDEVEAMLNAYSIDAPLTVAVVNSAIPNSPAVAVWWSNKQDFQPPQRLKLQVHQMCIEAGPVPKPPTSVRIKNIDAKYVTVRLLAPSFYRQFVMGAPKQDNPSNVIGACAQAIGCRASLLTGGNWQRVIHKKGSIVIGHVRVTEDIADRLLAASGKHAFFCTSLAKDSPRKTVAWLPRDTQFSDEDYWNYAVSQAAQHQLPLALRQGGGQDLGLAGADPDLFGKQGPKHWAVFDAPRSWGQEDAQSFLNEVKWRHVEVVHRKRATKKGLPVWIVKAQPPEGYKPQHHDSCSYSDDSLCITVAPETRSTKRTAPWETEPLRGPKKKWVDKASTCEVAPTLLDHSDDEEAANEMLRNARPKAKASCPSERVRSRSPRNRHHDQDDANCKDQPPDPDGLLASTLGLKPVDCGGRGDCAFRALAWLLAQQQGKQFDDDALAREAASLRLKCALHVCKHKATFASFWTPDGEGDESDQEVISGAQVWGDAPAPTTFEEYLKVIAKASTWADGLMLEGLAQRLGCPILVWVWSQSHTSWQRVVLAPWVDDGIAGRAKKSPLPLCLALRQGHFRALIFEDLDSKCPQTWLHETPRRKPSELRGAGKKDTFVGLGLPTCTPSRRGDKAADSLSLPSCTPSRRGQALSVCTAARSFRASKSVPSASSKAPVRKSPSFCSAFSRPSGASKPKIEASERDFGLFRVQSCSFSCNSCPKTEASVSAKSLVRKSASCEGLKRPFGTSKSEIEASQRDFLPTRSKPAGDVIAVPITTPVRKRKADVLGDSLTSKRRKKCEGGSSGTAPADLSELDRLVAEASVNRDPRLWTCPLCQERCETSKSGRALSD